jgi:hypothetical protein
VLTPLVEQAADLASRIEAVALARRLNEHAHNGFPLAVRYFSPGG